MLSIVEQKCMHILPKNLPVRNFRVNKKWQSGCSQPEGRGETAQHEVTVEEVFGIAHAGKVHRQIMPVPAVLSYSMASGAMGRPTG